MKKSSIALVVTGSLASLLGVDADISTGANVPFLDDLGWTAVGSGSFVLIIGIALLVMGIRRPGSPTGTAPVTVAAPAAA